MSKVKRTEIALQIGVDGESKQVVLMIRSRKGKLRETMWPPDRARELARRIVEAAAVADGSVQPGEGWYEGQAFDHEKTRWVE